MMTIEALKALCEKATKGPWETDGNNVKSGRYPVAIAYDPDDTLRQNETSLANAVFIAAARTALPLLIEVAKMAKATEDNCPYCNGEGFTVTTGTGMERDPNDPDGEPIPVPIPIQEQCEFCCGISAALKKFGECEMEGE